MKIRGFTLIELLVVISIIGVLSTIGLTSFKTANEKARNSRRIADIQQLRSALGMYRSEPGHTGYPTAETVGSDFSGISGYLSGKTVKDPKNSGSYVYSYTPAGCGATYCSSYTLTYYAEPEASPVPNYNP